MNRRNRLISWGSAVILAGFLQQLFAQTDPNVIVVFKTHFDIGYTSSAANVIQYFRTTMIDGALTTIDQTSSLPSGDQFRFTVPGWPLKKMLEDWSGQTAGRKTKITTALNNKHLFVHALPYTLQTEFLDLESLVRGMEFSSSICRANSLPLSTAGKMTDVPCHSWILPTLCKNAGITFLQLGPQRGLALPRLFFWEGPDGSRVLTFHTDGYGGAVVPPSDWTYSTWLAMQMGGDNSPPQTPADIAKVMDQIKGAGKTGRISNMEDFYTIISKQVNASVPVVRSDMPDHWIYGVASMPQETKLMRNTIPAIYATNALNTLLKAGRISPAGIDSTVAFAYEHSLRYGEHTWGSGYMSDVYGAEFTQQQSSGALKDVELTYKEKGDEIRMADSAISPVLASHLNLLVASVKATGRRVVVFNPLAWERNGVVRIKVSGTLPTALYDAAANDTVAAAAVLDTLVFIARNIPPCGYRTYTFLSGQAPAEGMLTLSRTLKTIENKYFKITVNPTSGGISSIIVKSDNRELIDGTSPYAFGSYMNERFSTVEQDNFNNSCNGGWGMTHYKVPTGVPYKMYKPANTSLSFDSSAIAVSAILTDGARTLYYKGMSIRVTLYADQPYIDLCWSINGKPIDNWPNADWFCFPFKVTSPSFRAMRQGGVVNPATDFFRGSSRYYYCLTGGVGIWGPDNRGVGVCCLDAPLTSLDQPGVLKFNADFVPAKPGVFFNLFNNCWGTNYQEWLVNGDWSVRTRVWTIDSTFKAGRDIVTPSDETRQPLLAAFADNLPAGTMPIANSGLTLSRKGVEVTAFGPNPDGSGTILRLWELAGENGDLTVMFPPNMQVTSVQPVDLRGTSAGAAIGVSQNAFTVSMPHNSVKSYQFSYAATGVTNPLSMPVGGVREITMKVASGILLLPAQFRDKKVFVNVLDLRGRVIRTGMITTSQVNLKKRFAVPEGLYIVKAAIEQ